VVTDTVPIDPLSKPDTARCFRFLPLLAETIMNSRRDSVSAIFGCDNQLFLRAGTLARPWEFARQTYGPEQGDPRSPPSRAACAGKG